jgi:CheY-like chemotaxis protein
MARHVINLKSPPSQKLGFGIYWLRTLNEETRNIPIVFVTASVMTEGREEIVDIDNAGFIGKPINTRTFVKDISQFIK